jgi:hypothetical protein
MTASGEVMAKLPAHAELERWYRWLLWAYPAGYRRAHGEEILATLMDSAKPGRRRPARADVADLARGAVRQWFRLPVGLSAAVAAVLAAVVLGAVGAGAGSWLAWQTNELPSDTETLQTTETVAGAPLTATHVDRHDGRDRRLLARGEFGSRAFVSPEQVFPNWTIEAAQARLQADGWTLGRVTKSDSAGSYRGRDSDPYQGAVIQTLEGTRGGHTIHIWAHTDFTPDPAVAGTHLDTAIRTDARSWEPAAWLLGWLVGAVTGWLLTGWATYRLRRQTLPRRLTALTLWLTALGLAAHPTIRLYDTLITHAFTDAGEYPPPYYWVVAPPTAELVGGTLTAGLAILVLAATARKPSVWPTAAAT